MTDPTRAPVASESPFDRLGAQVADEPRVVLWPLGRSATIFAIAHTTLGEWRSWRDICDANAITDPLDLEAIPLALPADDAPTPAPRLFEAIPSTDPPVSIDLAAQDQLGVGPRVVEAQSSLFGECVLRVDDVTWDTFELSLRAPDEADFGAPVALALADFEGVTADAVRPVRRVLYSAGGQAMMVELTLDAFLVVWLARVWPLLLTGSSEGGRQSLVVPTDESGLLEVTP